MVGPTSPWSSSRAAALDEKIDGQPQPPAEAAEMVEILARAVEVAHRRGSSIAI